MAAEAQAGSNTETELPRVSEMKASAEALLLVLRMLSVLAMNALLAAAQVGSLSALPVLARLLKAPR